MYYWALDIIRSDTIFFEGSSKPEQKILQEFKKNIKPLVFEDTIEAFKRDSVYFNLDYQFFC